jgi:hypothetical protein
MSFRAQRGNPPRQKPRKGEISSRIVPRNGEPKEFFNKLLNGNYKGGGESGALVAQPELCGDGELRTAR